ncbi:MAG: serine hydrolase domain-containing protein [Gemmatimonadaceae bacterium]
MRAHLPVALASLVALATPAAAQRDVGAFADTVFARWNSTHSPGCAVGIARDGKTVLARGYGMANLETGTPITAGTIFESGSVAKQFTATAIVLLAMDGKLNLSDPVRKYFPELPEYDKPLTIRHLLTHTSGLREWSSLVAAAGWPRGQRAHTQDDLLDIVFRQKAINYPVGDHYSYTNSGYAIAKTLVERVSGKSFQEFSQERIFGPLGMTHTRWRDDFTRIVPGRAQAYSREADGWHLDMPFESVVGPGGLLTTVGDWLVWNEALAKSSLRAGWTDSLTRRMRLNNGREITYALGIVVSEYRGVPEIGHSGSTGGYSTYLVRYPDRGNLSIGVLCNSAQGAAGTYAHQLADRLITDFPTQPALQGAAADRASVAKLYGIYRNDRTRSTIEMDDAVAPRVRSLPDGSYLIAAQRWVFDVGSDGTPRRASAISSDGDTVSYTHVGRTRWTPSRQQLMAFEGEYRSDEVGATYRIALEGDSLTHRLRPGLKRSLRPTHTDAFTLGGAAIWFSRDRGGKVVAMHISEGRMWDLVIPRLR